jgi:hypothetical protein
MLEQNVTLVGNKLQGTYIIGNDRSLYTVEMFNEWKDKFEKRVETTINNNDLIEGHLYKTVCGSTFLYLGKRYYISAKVKDINVKLSKQGTEHFIFSYFDPVARNYIDSVPDRLKQKAVEDLGISEFYKTYIEDTWEIRALERSQRSCDNPYFYIGKEKLDEDALVINTTNTDNIRYGYNIVTDGSNLYCSQLERYYRYSSSAPQKYQVANKPIFIDQTERTLICFNWSFRNENYKSIDSVTFNTRYKKVYITLSN